MKSWNYEGKPFTQDMVGDYEGFVYIVTDLSNGMKYIGKKNFHSKVKLKPLIGQNRKRKKVSSSDWEKYHGSAEELKLPVAVHGYNRLSREILHLCMSKGDMNYLELREQIVRDVLLKPDEYYNAFVGGKIHRNHVKNLCTSSEK